MEVGRVSAIVCGKPDAWSKQIQEYIDMANEHRSEFLGISLIRSEAFQIFMSSAATVIQQDAGERSVALRAPQHCVQCSLPTADDYSFWPARRLAPARSPCDGSHDRHEDELVELCHLADPNTLVQ